MCYVCGLACQMMYIRALAIARMERLSRPLGKQSVLTAVCSLLSLSA
jgi:hypothetical protein